MSYYPRQLTASQKRVLEEFLAGTFDTKNLMYRLQMSQSTLSTTLLSIFRREGVGSRTELLEKYRKAEIEKLRAALSNRESFTTNQPGSQASV
jgi:DNA-binding CsgD family transcriptional regulator